LSLVKNNYLGAAQFFLAAAQSAGFSDSDKLDEAVDDLTRQPTLRFLAGPRMAGWALLESNQERW
jgi:hypothetical protein